MTRFRSGTNELRIETGRYEGGITIARENRKCWFGCDAIEDEVHVILDCDMYDDFRSDLKKSLKIKDIKNKSLKQLFGGGSLEVTREVCIFLKRALARRKRILKVKGG